MESLRDEIIISLQAMDNASIRTNGLEWLVAAKNVQDNADIMLAEIKSLQEQNAQLLERLKRVEEIRFQNG